MRFTSQEEYGLRCMLRLAWHENKGILTIDEIAKSEGLTKYYVAKLMRVLLGSGLIRSARGKNGGYILSRPSDEITLDETLEALDGRLFDSDTCKKYTGIRKHCVNKKGCSIKDIWSSLDKLIAEALSKTTLKDLAAGEKAADKWFKNNVVNIKSGKSSKKAVYV